MLPAPASRAGECGCHGGFPIMRLIEVRLYDALVSLRGEWEAILGAN